MTESRFHRPFPLVAALIPVISLIIVLFIGLVMLGQQPYIPLIIATTLGASVLMNGVAPNQYMSIVIPGRMVRGAYGKMGLHPKNLSRCLEDAGTLTSPLIPYNSCGAFMAATLGISTLAYPPFAFFNLITPVISYIYGLTGFTIVR